MTEPCNCGHHATVQALEREVAEATELLRAVDEEVGDYDLGRSLANTIAAFLAKHAEREEGK